MKLQRDMEACGNYSGKVIDRIDYSNGYSATVKHFTIPINFIKVTACALYKEHAVSTDKLPKERTAIYIGIGQSFAEVFSSAETKHKAKFPDYALIFNILSPEEINTITGGKLGWLYNN